MANPLPAVYLARHGETTWSLSGQHTGLTDLPLTPRGEQNARALGGRLRSLAVDHVLTSPLARARRTCEIAGFGLRAAIDRDLVEWDYGEYEGLRSAEILALRPGWELFRDGCPGGESPEAIGRRAGRVLDRVRALSGNTLIFSSGHILRVFAACWLGLPVSVGRNLLLGSASLSMLTYGHTLAEPAVGLWNERRHLEVGS